MSVHLARDIENLKKKILTLSASVEEMVFDAIKAVQNGQRTLAEQVVQRDNEIDLMEVEIEEDCLKILALHQPVAIDLRYIVAILKINNDLERVGDLASNIAQRAIDFTHDASIPQPFDLQNMAATTQAMLRMSLDALIKMDETVSKRVCAMDDQVDEMHRDNFNKLIELISGNPQKTGMYLNYLSLSRYLERIADLATNIAEDVIYLITGQIARHKPTV